MTQTIVTIAGRNYEATPLIIVGDLVERDGHTIRVTERRWTYESTGMYSGYTGSKRYTEEYDWKLTITGEVVDNGTSGEARDSRLHRDKGAYVERDGHFAGDRCVPEPW